jgi:hypothetical protein
MSVGGANSTQSVQQLKRRPVPFLQELTVKEGKLFIAAAPGHRIEFALLGMALGAMSARSARILLLASSGMSVPDFRAAKQLDPARLVRGFSESSLSSGT